MSNKWKTCRKINQDKERRMAKRQQYEAEKVKYEAMTDIGYYTEAIQKSKKNVSFKHSVQLALMQPLSSAYKYIHKFESGDYSADINTRRVTIQERGKTREIVPIRIGQRICEHVLNDNILIPLFQRQLIFNNGASTKGKGIDFARRRVNKSLWEMTQECGNDFYAIQFDFKGYFENIPHDTVYEIMRENIKDEAAFEITMNIVTSYPLANLELQKNTMTKQVYEQEKEKILNYQSHGISLGSQTSQLIALVVPNKLDHYIQDTLKIRHYVRYMDDGLLLVKGKKKAQRVLAAIQKYAEKIGLKFNIKKTRIIKAKKGFTFLKIKYYIQENGHIVKKLDHKSVVRERRKLKKMKMLVDNGKATAEDAYNSVQSWASHTKNAMSFHAERDMWRLYEDLFIRKEEAA